MGLSENLIGNVIYRGFEIFDYDTHTHTTDIIDDPNFTNLFDIRYFCQY